MSGHCSRGRVLAVVTAGDARRIADAYECGHCRSEVTLSRDAFGIHHLSVAHDDGCPVLTGALDALPDWLRALGETR